MPEDKKIETTPEITYDAKTERQDLMWTYQFWYMCKLRFPYNDTFTRRHDQILKDLRQHFVEGGLSGSQADREVNRIVIEANNRLPSEFQKWLESKPLPENSKPLPIPRVSKPVFTNNAEFRKYKKNQNKHR